MKKTILLGSILILIIMMLSVSRAIVSNNLSTSGIDLDKTEKELSYFKTKNSLLREKLLSITSLEYIASKAASFGFVENKKNISLNNPLSIAIKQ